MAIIAILAALVLYAGLGVLGKAARSRASAEIQAMSTALESYKTDNGIYPTDASLLTNTYPSDSSATLTTYQPGATGLYTNLAGMNFYQQTTGLNTGAKAYMQFKANQVGNPGGPLSYVKDPWGNPYGYSTGAGTSTPYNGQGFFDLWSTGGKTGGSGNTNAYIQNW